MTGAGGNLVTDTDRSLVGDAAARLNSVRLPNEMPAPLVTGAGT